MKLSASQRKAVPKSEFGLPAKKTAANPTGKGGFPMPDRRHAGIAKSYARQGVEKGTLSPSAEKKIDSKANAILGKAKGKK